MTDSASQNVSQALYHYLCHHIVGSEENVNTIRMMNSVRDNLQSDAESTSITSGSFGEGLSMRDSDIDVMTVWQDCEVCEDKHICFNADRTIFSMKMEDTQAGFTMLRALQCNEQVLLKLCDQVGSDFYLSSLAFRQSFICPLYPIIHGPCVTDKHGKIDRAVCLISKLWITPAKQWITRSNNAWPSYDVKQSIVQHGVLFVPIGVKGSTKEDLEWRMSFSVGEKLLIYSFTHTQLLCYTLMKILLKDVIDIDIDCRELLCSYFMKTILFWICEELPSSIWKSEYLILCYMRCFRRLMYYVEYKVCPHYFIPENNLFENKIQGQARKRLLNKLYILNSYGWQCILLSDQISNFKTLTLSSIKDSSCLHVNSVEILLKSIMVLADNINETHDDNFERATNKVLSTKSSKIKYLYLYYMSQCGGRKQLQPFKDMSGNKSTYKQYKTVVRTLLLNTHHDAVSGWLVLASFFYTRKHYNKALYIAQYSLLKCTPEKLHKYSKFEDSHHELFNLQLLKNINIVQLWRFFILDFVTLNSCLKPEELQMIGPTLISPVVCAHLLCFLCHYHLQNSKLCWDSFMDLQLTIKENYFISGPTEKALSYNILGICCLLLGDIELARHVFMQSIVLWPNNLENVAFEIVSLIRRM